MGTFISRAERLITGRVEELRPQKSQARETRLHQCNTPNDSRLPWQLKWTFGTSRSLTANICAILITGRVPEDCHGSAPDLIDRFPCKHFLLEFQFVHQLLRTPRK